MLLVTKLVPKNTCGLIENWKKIFFFFSYRYQPIVESKMAFGSLLGRSTQILVSFLWSAMSQSHWLEGFESSEFFVIYIWGVLPHVQFFQLHCILVQLELSAVIIMKHCSVISFIEKHICLFIFQRLFITYITYGFPWDSLQHVGCVILKWMFIFSLVNDFIA